MKKEIKKSYTEKEEQRAIELLKNPKLLDEFLKTCHSRYLGRDKELKLLKLATVSRKFDRGISVIITGTSSVGKSELIRTVTETVCDEGKEDFSKITKQYLMYCDEPLDHKVFTFFEMHGGDDAAYSLRTAISEGMLRLGTVETTGGMKAKVIEKSTEGLVLLSTTTKSNIDWELNTRVVAVELTYDEELAKLVIKKKVAPPSGDADFMPFEVWQVADHLVEPKEVIIPYWEGLIRLFPTGEERYQRDFEKVVTLIKASALLHQFQRKEDSEGKLIATIEDYTNVYELRDLLTQSVASVPQHIIKFLKKADELNNGGYVTREKIREELDMSKTTIKRYVSAAQKLNLIEVYGRGQKQQVAVLEIPDEFESPLPKPSDLSEDSLEGKEGAGDIEQLLKEYLAKDSSIDYSGSEGSELNKSPKYKGLLAMAH